MLEHEGQRGRHWDFMLEADGTLRTWTLEEPPAAGRAVAAQTLADHRIEYLDFEGPVSGGRGTVRRWDRGTFELLAESGVGLEVRLMGERIAGRALLRHCAGGWEFVLEDRQDQR